MSQKSKLRFLLALGGQRVVVLDKQYKTHLYADLSDGRKNISPIRLCTAVQSR